MIKTCLDYHRATSYDRFEMSGHSLDWANRPKVFKEYPGITSLALPREVQLPKGNLFAILGERAVEGLPKPLDLKALSLMLFLSNTHTASARTPEGEFFFRSTASAGALYPTEIYVASHEVRGLDNGLYHFAIQDRSLAPLRKGDVSGMVERQASQVTFFMTAIFFRSAWKYGARAYRYHLLDTGHVAENLILALKAAKVPFSVTYDFDDREVNRLLGLDEQREVALAIINVPGGEGISFELKGPHPAVPAPLLQDGGVSARETDYPAIRQIHEAGLPVCSELGKVVHALGPVPRIWTPLETSAPPPEVMDYPDAVFRRRSRRNFIRESLGSNAVNALLRCLCRSEGSPYDQSVAVGFLVGAAEGMEPGFYLLHRKEESWALVSPGKFLARSASICLEQAWLVNAGLHFLFLADLEGLEKAWGPRGYRYAMLTAGRLGQRLYVAAEAMGLGCCGVGALYDGEAMDLLGLSQSSRLLYLVAVGRIKRS